MSIRKRPALAMLAVLLAATTATAQDAAMKPPGMDEAGNHEAAKVFPFAVHEQTLDNGLHVVVIPYDSPGVVAYFSVVRTGSRQEVEPGHSGFAHFFEHIMFRGTDRYSAAAYNDELRRMGADSNAFTTDDFTNYYIIGPSSSLTTMMDIESDRFKNLKYSEDAFRTEALAVLGEYNKNASSPYRQMYERMRDLAFSKHTYQHTTMGFVEDIKAMPDYYDYSLSFFDRFYRPENVVLLIVGDVDPAKTFTLAKTYYGDWKRGYKPVEIAAEPEPTEGHSGHVDWPAPTRPYVMMGYRAPAFDAAAKDTAALDLISQLLFSEAAPLYQHLVVDEQWADQLDGEPPLHRDPYLFTITARAKSNELLPKVETAIVDAIGELQAAPVDAARLERIKSHLRYAFALGMDSAGAVASNAAQAIELTGGVDAINTLYDTYETVTPEDVQRVAKTYFQPQRLTRVTLSYEAPAADAAAAETATEAGE